MIIATYFATMISCYLLIIYGDKITGAENKAKPSEIYIEGPVAFIIVFFVPLIPFLNILFFGYLLLFIIFETIIERKYLTKFNYWFVKLLERLEK